MNYYENINNIFTKYVGTDDKNLYEHTLRVALNSSKISDSLLLSDTNKALAYAIAIISELGKYKNKETINLLFDDGILRNFIKEEVYDDIIRSVIYSFESKIIPDYYPEDVLLQLRVLNAAHKLDQLYMASLTNDVELTGELKVSSNILNNFSNFKECNPKDIKTPLDEVINKLSYIFSLNDKYSIYIVEQEKYVDKIVANLNLSDQTIINLFDQLKIIVTKYIRKRIGETYHGW